MAFKILFRKEWDYILFKKFNNYLFINLFLKLFITVHHFLGSNSKGTQKVNGKIKKKLHLVIYIHYSADN
jgi:hypothetical protein